MADNAVVPKTAFSHSLTFEVHAGILAGYETVFPGLRLNAALSISTPSASRGITDERLMGTLSTCLEEVRRFYDYLESIYRSYS